MNILYSPPRSEYSSSHAFRESSYKVPIGRSRQPLVCTSHAPSRVAELLDLMSCRYIPNISHIFFVASSECNGLQVNSRQISSVSHKTYSARLIIHIESAYQFPCFRVEDREFAFAPRGGVGMVARNIKCH